MKKESHKKKLPVSIILSVLLGAVIIGGLYYWQTKNEKELGSDLKPIGDCTKMCQYVSSGEKAACFTSCQKILKNVETNPEIKLKK